MTGWDALVDRGPAPDDLCVRAKERGWPDDLVTRLVAIGTPRDEIEWNLERDTPTVDEVVREVAMRERLMFGTLRTREASRSDRRAFADLWANSPEDVGEWAVTVERSPNAFAAFQLQERVTIGVLEDRGVLLACAAAAHLNTRVGGVPCAVRCVQAIRVRTEGRGQGLSQLIQRAQAGPLFPYFHAQFFYIRAQNLGAVQWLDHQYEGFRRDHEAGADDVPGVRVEVAQYGALPFDGDASGIRPARPGDLRRCAALINSANKGLDLFRESSPAQLRGRLHVWSDGPKPQWWGEEQQPYGWGDFYVVEDAAGRVIACAGLWDRARDTREVWVHKATGERRVVARAALLDVGVEAGQEAALARLVGFLIGKTHEMGRPLLMAPLQHLPAVADLLADREPVPEVRGLSWTLFDDGTDTFRRLRTVTPTRPHTDLAYW